MGGRGGHSIIHYVTFTGPKPGIPRNLTVTEIANGFMISWQAPIERANLIQYYTIKYRTDGPWKNLNKNSIRPVDTNYLGKFQCV